jgi:hypothetical protein
MEAGMILVWPVCPEGEFQSLSREECDIVRSSCCPGPGVEPIWAVQGSQQSKPLKPCFCWGGLDTPRLGLKESLIRIFGD